MTPEVYNKLLLDLQNDINIFLNQSLLNPHGFGNMPDSDEGTIPEQWPYKKAYIHVSGGWLETLNNIPVDPNHPEEKRFTTELRDGTIIYNNCFQTNPLKLTKQDVIVRLQTESQIYIPEYREVKDGKFTLAFVSHPGYYNNKQRIAAWSKPLSTNHFYKQDFEVGNEHSFLINTNVQGTTYMWGAPFLILTTTSSSWAEETIVDTTYSLNPIRGTLTEINNLSNFTILWR